MCEPKLWRWAMNSNDFSRPEYEGEYDDNEDIPENHADDEDIE